MRVLVIEDNADIAANILDFLEAEGMRADHAADGLGGLHLALTQTYDVLMLDIMLPGMDGLQVCEKLRQNGHQTPILMLTARDTLPDKLAGFRAGTDDYLVKPFDLPELVARLHALAGRGQRPNGQILKVGDLEMNLGTMHVTRGGQRLVLNHLCLRILQELMRGSPNLITREELTDRIWGDSPPGSDALRTHLYNLRQVVDKPFDTPLLHTVRSIGYRLAADNDA